MTEENKPDEEKVVPLFGGDRDVWVPIQHIKEDETICPPDEVLQNLIGDLDYVVVLGRNKDGEMVLASSIRRMADINYLVDSIKARIVMWGD